MSCFAICCCNVFSPLCVLSIHGCNAEMRATISIFVEFCFNNNNNNSAASVDDALMDITHVIRAEEHLTNTLRQVNK